MLPLWIIDLREKSDRREHFTSLLGKLDHVKLPTEIFSDDDNAYVDNAKGSISDGSLNPQAEINSNADPSAPELGEQTGTIKEIIEEEYKKIAERESIIRGDYWQYSGMADIYNSISDETSDPNSFAVENESAVNDDSQEISDTENAREENAAMVSAMKIYHFQSELVKEGQKFIRSLRESNARPDVKINIIVLGDVTEKLTQTVFPSIAAIIQKEKGRILASHIHQGVEIVGMLYIPSNINTLSVEKRTCIRRTLTEIEMQHKAVTIRGYDHMMLYQDVQNRMECKYRALDDKSVAEYLFQCVVNLYLACDESHPLISGTASADTFYFSMGACSLYFDTDNEDRKARHNLAMNFIRALKSEGDGEKVADETLHILNDEEYNPKSFFTADALKQLEVDDIDDEPPLHPVRDYLAKHLSRIYYNSYLRFFTKRIHGKIVDSIDKSTKIALESIAAESKRRFNDAPKHLLEGIRNVLANLSSDDGGIPAVIRLLKEMKGNLSQKKNDVAGVMDLEFWNKIMYHDKGYIPKDMEDIFIEYHDVYKSDIRSKSGGTGQFQMKKEIIDHLNGLLSREATMLSRICRSVLLGIMSALAIVPLLILIDNYVIPLGNVAKHSLWWGIGIFCIPAICQVFSYFKYNRKKEKAKRSLQAIYLHDAYARVANRIESEITGFYTKLISLADRYEKRCESIMKELEDGLEGNVDGASLVPRTMFNQPLIEGSFGETSLLPFSEAEDNWVNINFIRYKLSEIDKKEYFLFINNHYNMIADLFKGISLCENLLRRVTPEGKEELVSKEQQEKEQEEQWYKLRDNFQKELKDVVALAIQPREDATVGEKIISYCTLKTGNTQLLRPMVEYSATNGELVSSADTEFLDVKMNVSAMEGQILPHVSAHNRKFQIDRYSPLYKKYLFITRWRSFNQFSLNRILPMEDFDDKVRSKLVSKYKGNKNESTLASNCDSSLLLWALCGDDVTQEWYRLFPEDSYSQALDDKEIFREILNQED